MAQGIQFQISVLLIF